MILYNFELVKMFGEQKDIPEWWRIPQYKAKQSPLDIWLVMLWGLQYQAWSWASVANVQNLCPFGLIRPVDLSLKYNRYAAMQIWMLIYIQIWYFVKGMYTINVLWQDIYLLHPLVVGIERVLQAI